MPSKLSKTGVRDLSRTASADFYLFWLRLKQILFVSSIVAVCGFFLSITMFYRFNNLDSKLKPSVKKAQKTLVK